MSDESYADVLFIIEAFEHEIEQRTILISQIERRFVLANSPLTVGETIKVRCNGKLAPCRVERMDLDRYAYSGLGLPVDFGFKAYLTVLTAAGEPSKQYTGTITRGLFKGKTGDWYMHGQYSGDKFGQQRVK